MFNFFKRKKIDDKNITNFNEVLKAINIFILLSDWEKAKFALSEIKTKENESFNILLKKIDNNWKLYWNNEKERQIKIYKNKVNKLNTLENKLIDSERIYNINAVKEKFNIRFNKIKSEIDLLVWKGKYKESLSVLHSFLEENKDKNSIIRYFNREKKYILKNIEKTKKDEAKKLKNDTKLEALALIWKHSNIENNNNNNNNKVNINENNNEFFFKKMIKKFNFYTTLEEWIKKKKLLDEVSMLIEENNRVKNDIAVSKLAKIHKWMVKEIKNNKIIWYELYWKILWADKISWDTFALNENKLKYNFFLWDATWHWIRAWFIITLISWLFKKFVEWSNIQKLCYEINNGLKQDLKNRNFITWVFFELQKKDINKINFVWMWHEPMLIYRSKEQKIEKVIPWWLAAWIRLIKKIDDLKVKELILENNDVLIVYSDWMIENKSSTWEFYWLEKLQKSFLKASINNNDINSIYKNIIDDVQLFQWWCNFLDDVSVLLIKRNNMKDIIDKKSDYLTELKIKEWLKNNEIKVLEWKNKEEIKIELEKIKKAKETERIIKILENLYYTWEILKLKEEAIRYIKEWFIHKKINFYLKKALDNETKYKIDQKSQKIKNKYNVLLELYKKWEYDTVIKEIETIISKDGNI